MGQKKKFNYVDFILKYLSVILMIIALIYIGVNNHYFFKVNNIISILLQTASLAIMAMGMTFVLITGGIDLSIPPVMALGAILGRFICSMEEMDLLLSYYACSWCWMWSCEWLCNSIPEYDSVYRNSIPADNYIWSLFMDCI